MTDRPDILIYEPDPVVAMDLSGMMAALRPGARVVTAATLDEALALLAGAPGLAVLHAAPDRMPDPRPANVRIVLLGDAAESDSKGLPVLLRPFSEDDVASLLNRLG